MASKNTPEVIFPLDPLEGITTTADDRRRAICGILESYNSNYDVLAEAIQNAVDAVEDAFLSKQHGPFLIHITVNLLDNTLTVLDTGIGMNPQQVARGFCPNVSFKNDAKLLNKRGAEGAYRGYKGVGLTFLAYGTDDILLHSKQERTSIKTRMRYGRAWAQGERSESALVVVDNSNTALDNHPRGTLVRVSFSPATRPRSLTHLASNPDVWPTIIKTRSAVGQILINRNALVKFEVQLTVIDADGPHEYKVDPVFYYPHLVARKPPFRFLDLPEYYKRHSEHAKPPAEKLRQDGLFLEWNTDRIHEEMTADQKANFAPELEQYTPTLYAFIPYQGSVWGEVNELLSGVKNRTHLYPGLLIAVNRQRLADKFEIEASRFETFSRNALVIVHFNNAKPDYGRKTLQDDVLNLAKRAADRVIQYLARQRELLKPAGEAPTPGQREVEKSHGDWLFNVRTHAANSPLHVPPLSYVSTPLTEQDVVGLFHQLTALGVFPGIRVFATSQIRTYDCLVQFDCAADTVGLKYESIDRNPLGLSPYILGDKDRYQTRHLTVEFKNNLDALVDEFTSTSRKAYTHIDACVCWSVVSAKFEGYDIEEVMEGTLDERAFPGVTHFLRRDGDTHIIQVIMLKKVVEMVQAGYVPITSTGESAIVPKKKQR